MSLIITAYTQESIVIGADSCTTTYFTKNNKELYKYGTSGEKIFLLNNKIGIAACGNAMINGTLLSVLIDKYIYSKKEEDVNIRQVELHL